jgi:predicted ATPase
MREVGGETRYRLLETVRQYGKEKLEESGEEAEVGRRHAGYYGLLAKGRAVKVHPRAKPTLTAT